MLLEGVFDLLWELFKQRRWGGSVGFVHVLMYPVLML